MPMKQMSIIDFLVEREPTASWFPIILDVKPVVPEKIEYGEPKMEKVLKSVHHESYFQGKKTCKDKATGETKEYDDYKPTQSDWERFTPEQIIRRQNLLLTKANPSLRKKFNYIAIKTDFLKHVDLDCPEYSQRYKDLLETHPYFKSATKSFGRHILFTCDKIPPAKRTDLINDVVPSNEKGQTGVELLAGQWSYCRIDTIVHNADCEDMTFDFTPYLASNDHTFKRDKTKKPSKPIEKTPEEASTDDEVKSMDSAEQTTTNDIFHQDPLSRLRELLDLIKIPKKDRTKWQTVCDCIKSLGLNEGDWLLFARNNSLNLDKEKLSLWNLVKGTKGVYYLHSLAATSSPIKHEAYIKKYKVSLLSPAIRQQIDEMDANGFIEDPKVFYQTTRYIEAKAMLERKFFKLEHPIAFVRIDEDDPREEMMFYKERQFELYCEGKEGIPTFLLKDKDKDSAKSFSFTQLWRKDRNHRMYSKVVFQTDPKFFNKDQYNLFNGFKLDDKLVTEQIDENQSSFLLLLKKHCQKPEIYEFFKCWIAHIIQKPYLKTEIAIVLYSALGGVGKNCIVDGIKALLGNKYCGFVSNIKDLGKNFNSDLCNKLLIFGDEVCSKAQEMSNVIKDVVTRKEVKLEKKTFDPIPIDDRANYMFTTNNENCFKIDDQDRRMFFVKCVEEALTSTESTKFYNDLEDQNTMRKLFNFFKDYKQQYIKDGDNVYTIGRGQRAPYTLYKTQLGFENMPAYIQMLYKSTQIFTNQRILSTDLHKIAVEYARKNYMSSSFTVREFGVGMNKYIEKIKVRGSSGNFYKFGQALEIREMLFQANEDYYRYIYQITGDETPDFSGMSFDSCGSMVKDTDDILNASDSERNYYLEKCIIPKK